MEEAFDFADVVDDEDYVGGSVVGFSELLREAGNFTVDVDDCEVYVVVLVGLGVVEELVGAEVADFL